MADQLNFTTRRAPASRRIAPLALPGLFALTAAFALLAVFATPGADARTARAVARHSSGWWHPPQHLTWFWWLDKKVTDNTHPVAAYDIDAFENPASEVHALHELGKHVICYVDVGTAEDFRPDYGEFPKSVLGKSNGWPGEKWLDIRQLSVIEPIMEARFQLCAEKGFDAVEPDNIEAFSNKSGFEVTPQQQIAYNEWVADDVHSLGMAVLQKNDGEQTPQLHSYFDGALSEQCNQYEECADFQPYLAAGEPVLNAEYRKRTSQFCAADRAAGIMGARFALSLNGKKFEPC
jgi:hypothetical protein